jgi:hypothetical protein
MPSLTLAEAAAQVGVNRSTLLRQIKRGLLSGARDPSGAWTIDTSELFRVFPLVSAEAPPRAVPQDAEVDAQVSALRAQLAEMRSQRDSWQAMAERLTSALPKPAQPTPDETPRPRRWWQRRSTG